MILSTATSSCLANQILPDTPAVIPDGTKLIVGTSAPTDNRVSRYVNNARVYKDESVFNTVQMMNELNRGGILVLDHDDSLAGLFAEQDFLSKILAKQKLFGQTFVSAVMTHVSKLVTVNEGTSLFDCRKLMMRKTICHFGVISMRSICSQ